jgi:flagellar P-ring protein precursor FlgI
MVAKIPEGATIQNGVEMATVVDGKMYLDLDEQDATTAERVETAINKVLPEFQAIAENSRSIRLLLPTGYSSTSAQARLGEIKVQADMEARVVINERTGTIVIGGNVRLGPCALAKGSISITITENIEVSQPNAFSGGTTQVVANKTLSVNEDPANIALLVTQKQTPDKPETTVADLAQLFQSLKLKASDIIDILQSLKSQGALKAKLVLE